MNKSNFFRTKDTLAYKAEQKVNEIVSLFQKQIKYLSPAEIREKDIQRMNDIKQIHKDFLDELKELVIIKVNKPEYNFIISNLVDTVYYQTHCSLKKCESEFLYSNKFTSIFNKREN